ncbi:MAG TPA: FecR domain-containing protein [Verrucomicrobiae bacterium]|nr:FecR domain-containing protein [Verrucomicrobiae bacterium]
MRRVSRTSMGFAAATALLWSGAAMAEPEIGAVIQQDYSGAVGTRTAGQSEDLVYTQTLFAEERVDTSETASTSLEFLDKTSLYVGNRSSVVLDRFIYDPSTQHGEAAINFTKGAFRFITGNIKSKEAVNLNTPTASMVIRGTHLLIFVLADGTSEINVLEGAVDLTPCESTEPQRVNAGQAITITPSCDTARSIARPDTQRADLIPQWPTDLAAIQDVAPAAGDEDEENFYDNEESGKSHERNERDRKGNDG